MQGTITAAVRRIVREEVKAVFKAREAPKPTPRPMPTCCVHCSDQKHEYFTRHGYEPTWTTAQVAEFLGLKRKTVYNMISNGEPGFPKPIKRGGLNTFIPSEVAAYRARALDPDQRDAQF